MYLTEILSRCSEIEGRVARLYRTLAERFQHGAGTASLWRELALEQETHADILNHERRSFDEREESGPFLPEYVPRLEHVGSVLADLEKRVEGLQTFDEALALAVALEQAELEDLYDDLVVQGHPAFKLISERLEAALSARPAATVPGLPRVRRPKRRPSTD